MRRFPFLNFIDHHAAIYVLSNLMKLPPDCRKCSFHAFRKLQFPPAVSQSAPRTQRATAQFARGAGNVFRKVSEREIFARHVAFSSEMFGSLGKADSHPFARLVTKHNHVLENFPTDAQFSIFEVNPSQFGSPSEISRLQMSPCLAFNTSSHALMMTERPGKSSLPACYHSFLMCSRTCSPSHMSMPQGKP
jgi:hypothetical protein